MANYYQQEIETMPQDQLRALQNERLVAQVKHGLYVEKTL